VRIASDATWLVSLFWNPANLPRWLATRFASSSASQEIEASLLAAFYREFVHNVGQYCIEMNSGRLRGGVARYRAALQRLQNESEDPRGSNGGRSETLGKAVPPGESATTGVHIAFVGQVNAGKSSLINAFLGENRARCDVLAATDKIERYRFTVPQSGQQFELLDTPGYGSAELTSEQRAAIRTAWSQADIVLLVMDVTSPARQADWRLISELSDWYASQGHLKQPPAIGVLTHVDGLSPMMEWQPPYNWQWPTRPKEQSMRAAVDYTEQIFGDKLTAVIPVCSDSAKSRTFGVEEWLKPAVIASLGEAKAALVVRTLYRDADSEKMRLLLGQFRASGMKLLKTLLENH
jgi:predicted GTPase